MITVADILALPAFEQVQPLVLCEGAESREVHNVGILDCAPDKDGGYESYIPGEFIVAVKRLFIQIWQSQRLRVTHLKRQDFPVTA